MEYNFYCHFQQVVEVSEEQLANDDDLAAAVIAQRQKDKPHMMPAPAMKMKVDEVLKISIITRQMNAV